MGFFDRFKKEKNSDKLQVKQMKEAKASEGAKEGKVAAENTEKLDKTGNTSVRSDNLRKEAPAKAEVSEAKGKEEKESYVDFLSYYLGAVTLRQIAFGDMVVQDRDWNVDLEEQTIAFGHDIYKIKLLGTESQETGTWMWGFANPGGFSENLTEDALKLFNMLREKGFDVVSGKEVPLSEYVNGHMLSAIAVGTHERPVCYYKCPYSASVSAYVLVEGLPREIFAPVEPQKMITTISSLIQQFSLNHKNLMESALKQCGYQVESSSNTVIGALEGKGKINCTFDEQGRISSLNAELEGEGQPA